jgi:hypothetical protein
MTRNGGQLDETVVSHENVVVSRELTTKDEGIVVTLRLRATDEQPARIHVTDEFPASLPIDAVCFNPEKGPNSGDVTPQRASIEQPLDDEPVEIEYGITLSEPVEEVQLDPPTIREVATGITRGASRQTDDGAPSSTIESWDFGPSKSFSSLIPSPGSGSSEPDGSDALESSNGTSNTNPESTETEGDGADDASPASVKEAVERITTGDQKPEDDATESSTVEEGERAGTEKDGAESVSDEPASETRQSIELRIDHLSARMEKFAAYTAGLEELIDDHGTASPAFGTISRRVSKTSMTASRRSRTTFRRCATK